MGITGGARETMEQAAIRKAQEEAIADARRKFSEDLISSRLDKMRRLKSLRRKS